MHAVNEEGLAEVEPARAQAYLGGVAELDATILGIHRRFLKNGKSTRAAYACEEFTESAEMQDVILWRYEAMPVDCHAHAKADNE